MDSAIESMKHRLMSRVSKGDSCWNWTGPLFPNGYGMLRLAKGSVTGAHRISWLVNRGYIPPGLVIIHQCDNKRCVRPSHLRLGTQQENMTDMVKKGRQGKAKGSQCYNAKLNEKKVVEIREMYATKRADLKKLSQMYEISMRSISQVIRNRSWKHVN